MSVISATGEQLTKSVLVLLSSIKGWRETVNEALCEFAISGVDNSFESRIILFEVRSHQVWLGMPLPEAFHLEAFLHETAA